MALETSYSSNPSGSAGFGGGAGRSDAAKGDYWELSKLRRCYTDYLFGKRQELDEQIDARRYYHGTQFTAEQLATFKKRKQPAMTFNRVQRKIDGVVGLIERLRQDPKAYPRTPQHEQGAELATAALRYCLDEQNWKAKSPQASKDGAVDGIGGIEIELVDGDKGDKEVGFELVDIASFFYDPRSYQMDFADARYMGVGKWVDKDIAQGMFPDADPSAFSGNDYELTNNSDKELRWYASTGVIKRIRLVDIWYKHKDGWCWAIISGNSILMEGRSYLKDEKGKEMCKYIMFSGNVDQDADRYGFVRNMKSAQDGINAKQSKMQHILASKRLIIQKGAGVPDIEVARREWARSDGVVETIGPVNESVKIDDQSFDFAGLAKLLELNNAEIENFGPNPALIGQGIENKSGRAIQLLQQAGIAELGPYIIANRGWKIRCYRGLFCAIQQHWTAERWIRVTDDDGLAQFIQLNTMQTNPQTGEPMMVNAIGSLDVDIILDEGPDAINMQQDSYEVMQSLGPQFGIQFPEIALELSPIQSSVKKKMLDKLEQQRNAPPPPDPKVQAMQIQSQLKQQEAEQGLVLEQQKMNGQLEGKQREAELDAKITLAKAQQDMELKERQAELEAACKQKQCEIDMQCELQRHGQKLQHEKSMNEIRVKAQGTAGKGSAAGGKSGGGSPGEAIKNAVDDMVSREADTTDIANNALKAVTKIGEGFDKLAAVMSAPKRAVYDESGKLTGSELAR